MTIPHYGKRNPGGLTAAAPGDTLYFAFASYNDSGDSEALTGIAVTDIEVIKNGIAVVRATDSGYSLISDTGQFGDRAGLYRFSVQLFNTNDDTGFYDIGSWYQVAVDSVVVDGKTVRLWAGSFEIGEPRANIVQIDGDTGAADRLGKLAGLQLKTDGTFDTGTGQSTNTLNITATASTDTGQVSNAVWNSIRTDHATAGSFGHDLADTGEIATAAWNFSARSLTAFAHDTGVADTVWKYSGRKLAVDTGIGEQVWDTVKTGHMDTGTFGWELGAGVHVVSVSDTGINERLTSLETGVTVTLLSDTGSVSRAVWNSLRADHTTDGTFGQRVLGDIKAVDGDTGAADIIAEAFADTGYVLRVSVEQLDGDTGAAAHLTAAFATQSTTTDTGLIANAAAIRTQTDKLTFDTGNELHADIRKVNNVTVGGTGADGNEWGPA